MYMSRYQSIHQVSKRLSTLNYQLLGFENYHQASFKHQCFKKPERTNKMKVSDDYFI
uniref:Uncharacterized protein n=1 Tax=Meloidogyne enterolobii TaxID=390850 RepID=A0A6V7UEI6_MELEN|nr:unnamed protein product [Meloidogyne enterolobii]